MKTYEIKTITTMKPYNNKNWWIDRDYIKPVIVKANSPKEALRAYCMNVMDNNYIEISKTAMNKAAAMYRDTENGTQQIGYVVTAPTEFEVSDWPCKWIKQYIELWAEFKEISEAF